MKKNKLAIIILALVIVTAAAAALHLTTRTQVPAGGIRVEWGGREAHIALEELELAGVHGTVLNGKGEEKAVDGQGVLLSDLLEQAGVGEYSTVTVTADDEYSAVVTAEEIAQPDKVYLLVQEDGARLVVFDDEDSKRNVSDVKLVSVS